MQQAILCPICKIESEPEVVKKHFSDNPDLPFHLQAFCRHCGSYIKNLPQHTIPIFHFGKHKGATIADVGRVDKAYLEWMVQQDIKPTLRKNIEAVLNVSNA